MQILLVEDDEMIGKAVQRGLVNAGYAVDWVMDGSNAVASLAQDVHDLVVLDLGLPDCDGMGLLLALRARQSMVPVLIATARDAVADRIAGLDAGADGYLLKPFDLLELTARVRALARRQTSPVATAMTVGSISLHPVNRTVHLDGSPVNVSGREFEILHALMVRPGAVLSREKLESLVYRWNKDIASNAIEVHVHNLRRKLGQATIKNVRGIGYRI